jgi:hypothetical protein
MKKLAISCVFMGIQGIHIQRDGCNLLFVASMKESAEVGVRRQFINYVEPSVQEDHS